MGLPSAVRCTTAGRHFVDEIVRIESVHQRIDIVNGFQRAVGCRQRRGKALSGVGQSGGFRPGVR